MRISRRLVSDRTDAARPLSKRQGQASDLPRDMGSETNPRAACDGARVDEGSVMRYYTTALLLASLALAAAPALATTPARAGDGSWQIRELQQRASGLDRYAAAEKHGASEWRELTQEQAEIKKMIATLESGGSVDVATLDQLQGRY